MTAQQMIAMAKVAGFCLIGRKIKTESFGSYPGGVAEVIELTPDATAPEIVLQVRHPSFGEIGVFDFEEVELVT